MSAATRNPTGHGENAAIIGVFTYLGMYLAGLVDDPNLSTVIVMVTTIAGKAIFTMINNAMGGTLASLLGAGAMKGAQLGVVLLALWLPLGCSWAITSEGAFANFGQSTISTCEEHGGECTVIEGAPVSEQAGSMIGGVLAGALRVLGLTYGVPTPALAPVPDG